MEGHPHTHNPWRKIMVMVEGIYSVEGGIVDLRGIANVAKRYKAYIYVDGQPTPLKHLAHQPRDLQVDPSEIDVLMDTFSRSFGNVQGDHRSRPHAKTGSMYVASMSPVVAQKVLAALNIISGADGSDIGSKKFVALRQTSNYFCHGFMDLGFNTSGDFDAPVIPVMMYHLSKSSELLARERLLHNLAVATIGFLVTLLLLARATYEG